MIKNKDRLKGNIQLKQGGITLLFLLPLYGADFFVEQHISKHRIINVQGYVERVEFTAGNNGIHNIDIKTQTNEIL